MSAAFQFMNGQIHRVEVKPQELRDSPLADSDGGSLVGILRQQPVDTTGGRREAGVKTSLGPIRFRYSAVRGTIPHLR
jgi:hypothetical protein